MKYCPKCNTPKELSQFYKRKTGPKAGTTYEKCKQCMKERGKTYYRQNIDHLKKLTMMRTRKGVAIKRQFLIKYKDKPCMDCGKKYPPYVMDLDHRDPKDKINDVAAMVHWNFSIEKIKKEIDKCDIVCANCHRIRTHKNMPS